MVWAHFISEFSPGWVIGRPGRPRKGQVQQTWGEVQAVQIPPSWFHLLSLSFLSHNFGMMLFLGLSREIKETPCQNTWCLARPLYMLLFYFFILKSVHGWEVSLMFPRKTTHMPPTFFLKSLEDSEGECLPLAWVTICIFLQSESLWRVKGAPLIIAPKRQKWTNTV